MHRHLQSFIHLLRGSLHPGHVACAVALGLLAGLVTGWNLSLAVVLLLVLVLNVPLRVFGEAWAACALLSLALTPVTYSLGRFLLEQTGLGQSLAPWADHPALLMFDLDRYTLIGGIAAAAVLAMPAAWLAAKATTTMEGYFRRWQEAAAANTPFEASSLHRLTCWQIFGDAARPQVIVKAGVLRQRGVALGVGAALLSAGMGWWFGPTTVEHEILRSLSVANQAEVNAGSLRLSISEGLLEIADLQIADPNQLDRDRLRIGVVTAQLSAGALLRGRAQIDRLLLEDVRGDVARQTRARPFGLSVPKFESLSTHDSSRGAHQDNDTGLHLDEYLSNWEPLRGQLSRLQQLLEKMEQLASLERGEQPPVGGPRPGYLAARSRRYDFGRQHPKVQIEQISVKGLSPQWGLGAQGSLQITNLCSRPKHSERPTQLAISAPEVAMELIATLHLHEPGSKHEFQFRCDEIDLARLIPAKSVRPLVDLQGGTLAISGRGWGNCNDFELAVNLDMRRLEAQVLGERRLAGLSADAWNQGLRQLGKLHTEAVLFGRWTSPRLRLDLQQLVVHYKQQLRAAGEHQLVQLIDDQIQRGESQLGRSGEPLPQLATAPTHTGPPNLAGPPNFAPTAGAVPPLAQANPAQSGLSPAGPYGEAPGFAISNAAANAAARSDPAQPAAAPTQAAPQGAPGQVADSAGPRYPAMNRNEQAVVQRRPLPARADQLFGPDALAGPTQGAAAAPANLVNEDRLLVDTAASSQATTSPLAGLQAPPPQGIDDNRTPAAPDINERDFGPPPVAGSELPATNTGLQYPESMRKGGAPSDSVLADVMESRPSVAKSATPAASEPFPDWQPQQQPAPKELQADASPVGFNAPPAIGLELGYDEGRMPAGRANSLVEPTPQAKTHATVSPSRSQLASRTTPAAGAAGPAGDTKKAEASKFRTFSKGVSTRVSGMGAKVKGILPWKKTTEEKDPQAGTAEESIDSLALEPPKVETPSNRTTATRVDGNPPKTAAAPTARTASSPENWAEPALPWYQRIWR